MRVLKPPHREVLDYKDVHIFLAGSIEMGKAEDWQTKFAKAFEDESNVVLFNPRRDEWDSSWEQSIDNPKFKEQVVWELDHLDSADVIVMHFDPNTMSPISLLELGLHAGRIGNVMVCCPKGFWRKGNVDIVCERYGISMYDTMEDLIADIKADLK
jgi:hypothetical protein